MKPTSKEIRQKNLKILIKQIGNQRIFAEACNLSPGHVSQMVTGNRAMGDEVARRIEDAIDLDRGWMDAEDGQISGADVISKEDLTYIKLLSKLPSDSRKSVYELIDKEYLKVKAKNMFK